MVYAQGHHLMAPVSPPVGLMKTVMVQKSVVVMVVVLGVLNQVRTL